MSEPCFIYVVTYENGRPLVRDDTGLVEAYITDKDAVYCAYQLYKSMNLITRVIPVQLPDVK